MDREEAGRPEYLNVAAVTMSSLQSPKENFRKIAGIVGTIMRDTPETRLIVFGGMILGWYDPAGMQGYSREISLHISHESLGPISQVAKHYGVYICLGLSENHEGTLYSSQILFDRLGDPRTIHRKKNLNQDEIDCGYRMGEDPFTITEIMGIRTALTTGADMARISNIVKLYYKKPDLILVSLTEDRDDNFTLAKFRARMLDTWMVNANRFGPEDDRTWEGNTSISNPWGRMVQTSTGREICLIQRIRIYSRNPVLRLLRRIAVHSLLPFFVLFNLKRLKSIF